MATQPQPIAQALPALSPLHDTHRSRYGTRRPFRNTLRPGVTR